MLLSLIIIVCLLILACGALVILHFRMSSAARLREQDQEKVVSELQGKLALSDQSCSRLINIEKEKEDAVKSAASMESRAAVAEGRLDEILKAKTAEDEKAAEKFHQSANTVSALQQENIRLVGQLASASEKANHAAELQSSTQAITRSRDEAIAAKSSAEAERAKALAELEGNQNLVAKLEKQFEETKMERNQAQDALAVARKTIGDLQGEVRTINGQFSEKVDSLEKSNVERQKQLTESTLAMENFLKMRDEALDAKSAAESERAKALAQLEGSQNLATKLEKQFEETKMERNQAQDALAVARKTIGDLQGEVRTINGQFSEKVDSLEKSNVERQKQLTESTLAMENLLKTRDEAIDAKSAAESERAKALAQLEGSQNLAAKLEKQLEETKAERTQAQDALGVARKTIGDLQGELSTIKVQAEEREKNFEQRSTERQRQFEEFQSKLDDNLRALTQQLYSEQGKAMLGEGRQQLEHTLSPFKDELKTLKERLEAVHTTDVRDRASLQQRLEEMLKAQGQLSTEANHLTRALTVNTKVQGAWGEIALERLFEESGLEKGIAYDMQVHVRDGEDQGRPDAVVYLPGKKAIPVDAKVSMTSFVEATKAVSEDQREAAMSAHLLSVRRHIKELSERDYPKLIKESLSEHTLDFTLLFMPSEAAFAAALKQDANLWSEAYKRRIVVVGPTTLLATLRVVDQIWRVERQNRNTDKIVELAADILKKLTASVEDFESVEKWLGNANKKFKEARDRLMSGRGNVMNKAQDMMRLGVRADEKAKELIDKVSEVMDEPQAIELQLTPEASRDLDVRA